MRMSSAQRLLEVTKGTKKPQTLEVHAGRLTRLMVAMARVTADTFGLSLCPHGEAPKRTSRNPIASLEHLG
jgi:hypothetical protein